jgi:alpha-glucoside transport system ATP-binding protein
MTLADRIVVLSAGHIEQVGPPLELYERPANLFVAQFIGSPMNIVPVKIDDAGDQTRVSPRRQLGLGSDCDGRERKGQSRQLRRPPGRPDADHRRQLLFEGTVDIVEALGEVTLLTSKT